MKNSATMFKLCLMLAMEKGYRANSKLGLFGLYLTMRELRTVYAENGYRIASKKIPEHVEKWKWIGDVESVGDISDINKSDDASVWFCVPREEMTICMVHAEKAGYEAKSVITKPQDVKEALRW